MTAPKPDCWLTLADDLRQVADRLATLAGNKTRPGDACVAINGSCSTSNHAVMAPLIDTIAAAFGTTAQVRPDGIASKYEAKAQVGQFKVWAYTYAPEPEDPEKAARRAELETLRAQLAEGGTR